MKISGRYLYGILAMIVVGVGVAGVARLAESDEHRRYSVHYDEHGDGDDDDDKGPSKIRYLDAEWLAECGACHVAYPARFLPAESWREIMTGLHDHFGSDASLDEETASRILNYLEQNARRKKIYPDASGRYPLRITDTKWFRREHVEPAARARNYPKLRNLANCGACHLQAEGGSYSEHDIRYPF